MGRVLAIDYGRKRVGLAVTDPFCMIATRLDTVHVSEIWAFLEKYFDQQKVDRVVIGYPVKLNNEPSEALRYINPFIKAFSKKYPLIPFELADERFTSILAHQAMLDAGLKKHDRQNKGLVDGVSATIILQSWLEQKKHLQ